MSHIGAVIPDGIYWCSHGYRGDITTTIWVKSGQVVMKRGSKRECRHGGDAELMLMDAGDVYTGHIARLEKAVTSQKQG